jgi:hypothetical protein
MLSLFSLDCMQAGLLQHLESAARFKQEQIRKATIVKQKQLREKSLERLNKARTIITTVVDCAFNSEAPPSSGQICGGLTPGVFPTGPAINKTSPNSAAEDTNAAMTLVNNDIKVHIPYCFVRAVGCT